MPSNKNTSIQSENVAQFIISGDTAPIILDKKIAEQIFIYGEYLKRKFKLDCCMEKKGGKFVKVDGKYKPLQKYSFDNLVIAFAGLFNINITSGNLFTDNSPIYEKLYSKSKNTYEFIYRLYKLGYRLFKRQLSAFRKPIRISGISYNREELPGIISFPYDLSHYTYERVIDFISDYRRMLDPGNNAFGNFAQFCYINLKMIGNTGTYRYYSEIVSRYFLYMNDLLSPLHIDKFYIDLFEVTTLPRFIRFPKLSNLHISDIESKPNESIPSKPTIKLDLSLRNTDTIQELCSRCCDAVSYYSYNYKESMGLPISQDDYRFICKYFDSDNTHSSTSTFRNRIIGLYLWDRHLASPNLSQSSIIENFIKFYKKTNPAVTKSKRQYQKIFARTTQSIEIGKYLPLS